MVYYPEIMDSVRQVQDALGKPTGIDYLLYLETTSAGTLINKLVPSVGAILIQFKINLLQCALSKKALVIDVPDEDEADSERALSLKQLKTRIESMLKQKSEQNKIFGQDIHFDAAMAGDAECAKVAQMGKNALKDSKLLKMLIQKFKSQSKVAELLGVHRSAVYKRFKQFNLLEMYY